MGVHIEDWKSVFFARCEVKGKRQAFNRAIERLKSELIREGDIFQMSEDYELEKRSIEREFHHKASV